MNTLTTRTAVLGVLLGALAAALILLPSSPARARGISVVGVTVGLPYGRCDAPLSYQAPYDGGVLPHVGCVNGGYAAYAAPGGSYALDDVHTFIAAGGRETRTLYSEPLSARTQTVDGKSVGALTLPQLFLSPQGGGVVTDAVSIVNGYTGQTISGTFDGVQGLASARYTSDLAVEGLIAIGSPASITLTGYLPAVGELRTDRVPSTPGFAPADAPVGALWLSGGCSPTAGCQIPVSVRRVGERYRFTATVSSRQVVNTAGAWQKLTLDSRVRLPSGNGYAYWTDMALYVRTLGGRLLVQLYTPGVTNASATVLGERARTLIARRARFELVRQWVARRSDGSVELIPAGTSLSGQAAAFPAIPVDARVVRTAGRVRALAFAWFDDPTPTLSDFSGDVVSEVEHDSVYAVVGRSRELVALHTVKLALPELWTR